MLSSPYLSTVAPANTSWLFNSRYTLTGNIFDFQNNATSRLRLGSDGVLSQTVSKTFTSTTTAISMINTQTASGSTAKSLYALSDGGTVTLTGSTNNTIGVISWSQGISGSTSNTNHISGFSMAPGGTGTLGNFDMFSASSGSVTASTLRYINYRSFTAKQGTSPTVTGFEDDPGDNAADVTRSTYGASFASKAGAWIAGNGTSTMPDWYGVLVEDQPFGVVGDNFSTLPRKHGFSIAMDSNFADNTESSAAPILGWTAAHTTDIASRRGGITVTTSSVMNLDISATTRLSLTSTAGTMTGDFKLGTAGNGFYVKEGTNATMGSVALSGGAATVNTTKVTANSRIFLDNQALGGTAGFLRVSARSAGTSFTITSSSGTDTSTVAWLIVEPA